MHQFVTHDFTADFEPVTFRISRKLQALKTHTCTKEACRLNIITSHHVNTNLQFWIKVGIYFQQGLFRCENLNCSWTKIPILLWSVQGSIQIPILQWSIQGSIQNPPLLHFIVSNATILAMTEVSVREIHRQYNINQASHWIFSSFVWATFAKNLTLLIVWCLYGKLLTKQCCSKCVNSLTKTFDNTGKRLTIKERSVD